MAARETQPQAALRHRDPAAGTPVLLHPCGACFHAARRICIHMTTGAGNSRYRSSGSGRQAPGRGSQMEAFVEVLNRFFGGPVMLAGMLAAGGILMLRTRFAAIRRLPAALRYAWEQIRPRTKAIPSPKEERPPSGVTPFQAVCTALSGTLGTGNIAGVGAALALGGSGALFWMWIGALLGMSVKYAEILLAMRTRERGREGWQGGPMYYLRCLKGGRWWAGLFGAACLGASFCMGNMAQSNTAAAALRAVFPLSERGLRILFLLLTVWIGAVIFGGVRRIARVTEWLVPFMAAGYLGGCIFVLVCHAAELPGVLSEIVTSAFSLQSAAGGAVGITLLQAMRIGITRGVFTNEAGLGSAPIAHAAAENPIPRTQALWGIVEVFLDTIVMCTMTGLVVLLAGIPEQAGPDGAAIVLAAFSRFLGEGAALLIGIATAVFAVASIIGWSYYGEACVRSLSRKNGILLLYKALYLGAVYAGAVSSIGLVWGLSDLCNSLMMCVNLTGVVFLSDWVRRESDALYTEISKKNVKKGKNRSKTGKPLDFCRKRKYIVR